MGMASKTQAQRIKVLKQQITELLAGQMQTEARIDAKFDSLGKMLRTRIASAFKEHQGRTTGKGKDLADSPSSHTVIGSSSSNGGGIID